MKYVITGSLGNISKPLAEALVKTGHDVTIITSKQENAAAIEAMGAKAAVGSVTDAAFLAQAFTGAGAVYTMVPPKLDATDWKAYIGSIGKNYADAIKKAATKYVVNLSSIGAHMADGAGPVSGLHRAENALNELKDVHIKHLRPAYFYNNLFANVSMIKHMDIIGGNSGGADTQMVIVDPADIAAIAVEELLQLNFSGHTIRYIASDEITNGDIAKTLGAAIGKPGLHWVEFTDEQSLQGMLGAGLPDEVAKNYVEMGAALRSGEMQSDYLKNRPAIFSKTKLADFAKVFAAVYNA